MERKIYNFPIDRCPHCEGEQFYINSQTSGIISFFVNSDGTETSNTEMYEGLNCDQNKYWNCGDCHKRLFEDSVAERL